MEHISVDNEGGVNATPPSISKQKAAWTPERREAKRQQILASLAKSKIEGTFCAQHDPSKPKYVKEDDKWTPEKVAAIKATKLESELVAKRSSKWTPEMREAARQRMLAACAKGKDALERKQRILSKARYLRSTVTGRVFAWNPHLAQRKDMEFLPGDAMEGGVT